MELEFGHELWSKAFWLGEVVHIQHHLLAHLILHFASIGISLFFLAFLGFLHQQCRNPC